MKKILKLIFKIVVILFALVGFGLLVAYILISLHLTNTKGIVDDQSDAFWKDGKLLAAVSITQNNTSAPDVFFNKKNYCLLKTIKENYIIL